MDHKNRTAFYLIFFVLATSYPVEAGIPDTPLETTRLFQDESDLLSPNLTGLAFDPQGRLWIGGLGGVTVYQSQRRITHFTPAQGLPSIDVQCVTRAPDGTMWVGSLTPSWTTARC